MRQKGGLICLLICGLSYHSIIFHSYGDVDGIEVLNKYMSYIDVFFFFLRSLFLPCFIILF